MSLHFIGMDRAREFSATVQDDRRNADLRVVVLKGFDTVNITVNKDQLKQIAEAISKETGDIPF